MPIFMDRHDIRDATAEAVAAAHVEDLKLQSEFACSCLTYWFDEQRGTVFCLIQAPNEAGVRELHRASHGLIPNQIIEVDPATVSAFLGRVADPESVAAKPLQEPAFRSIMFTDMANSSEITNTMGDDAGFNILNRHRAIIRQALLDHNGREVDRAGDGFLTCFASVSQAVSCALAVQREFDSHNHAEVEDVRIRVRIGLNAGEPVTDGDALFGSTINLTSRICAHAAPGQILASHVIRQLCAGRNFAFSPIGEVSLKGFPDPVELDEVVWAMEPSPVH